MKRTSYGLPSHLFCEVDVELHLINKETNEPLTIRKPLILKPEYLVDGLGHVRLPLSDYFDVEKFECKKINLLRYHSKIDISTINRPRPVFPTQYKTPKPNKKWSKYQRH